MANVNTDIVTNFVATPQVKNDSQQLHGVKRIAQGTIALAAGDLSASDTVMLAPVPTNASISSIKLFNDDLDSGSTNTTDVGLYTTAIAAVDDDAYASAITSLRAAVRTSLRPTIGPLIPAFLPKSSSRSTEITRVLVMLSSLLLCTPEALPLYESLSSEGTSEGFAGFCSSNSGEGGGSSRARRRCFARTNFKG